ncbi:hypothetical protein C5G87_07160 [Paenibacillus peoriae]|uniref:hypothetical protein n=1 Tax=Paenibacillus peoriae TaxID=59893 RepID=UPI000CEB9069|nr:hypothetical protein [Paenibacillus peoriae]PPQ49145.1 hypothetical protein C5G87_07160 [Paenibacillus peoriae]
MKNVMTRAWEIANAAVAKFGGKVKEYFSQALVIAWEEAKNAVKEVAHFGFIVAGKNETHTMFALEERAGLHVYPAWNKRNAQYELKYQVGMNKQTGKAVRFYTVENFKTDLEVVCGEVSEFLFIKKGAVTFQQ